MSVSRRNFLKGLGIGVFGVGVSSAIGWQAAPALAQSSPSASAITAFARFALGNMQITVLSDGMVPFEASTYAVNADPDALATVLDNNHMGSVINTGFNIMIIEDGDRKVMVDTGFGDFIFPGTEDGTGTGKLFSSLEFFGIKSTDITDVIITHFHPDHIAGASLDGQVAFANAQYHFPEIELGFLQSGIDIPAINGFIELANAKLQPLLDNDQLNLYQPDTELLTGINTIAAPGHTLGHTALMLDSDGQQLIHMVDAAPQSVISLHNPDWIFGFDAVPEEASATRKRMLEMATVDKVQVFGYHFPFPGLGYVSADGDGYRYIPSGV